MIYKPSIPLNRRIEDLYLDDCVNNKITMCIADYHKSNFPVPGKYDLKIIKSHAKSICEMNSTPLDLEKGLI